jgi:hypothetical protein
VVGAFVGSVSPAVIEAVLPVLPVESVAVVPPESPGQAVSKVGRRSREVRFIARPTTRVEPRCR